MGGTVRYRSLAALIIIVVLAGALGGAPPARAINIAFRGGDTDHYWDVAAAFCKDGVRLSTSEILHDDGSSGDSLKYSIVLSTTSSPLLQPLPARLAGGSGEPGLPLAGAVNAYAYATPQPPGSAQTLVLERWEHGVDAIEIESDPIGDLSLDDDRELLSGSVANCTVTSAPAFDDPPTPIAVSALSVAPGTPISLPIQASDADALDMVTLSPGALPAGASLDIGPAGNPTAATLRWAPTAGQIGPHTIVVDATDSTGRSARYTITIAVEFRVMLPAIQR